MLARTLVLTIRDSALARWVAVVCAVALLAVGFIHSVQHVNTPVPIVVTQADSNNLDDSTDIPKKAPGMIEHCFSCSMVTLADMAQPFVPYCITADLPMRRVDEKRSHPPVVEIPPPISTI